LDSVLLDARSRHYLPSLLATTIVDELSCDPKPDQTAIQQLVREQRLNEPLDSDVFDFSSSS